MSEIDLEHFQRVDMRVGRIVAVEDFPQARRPSYRLTVDFGVLGRRRSSAAIRPFYSREELQGRQVVCVLNLPPRRVAGFESQVLILGAMQADGRVILLRPDDEAQPGSPIA